MSNDKPLGNGRDRSRYVPLVDSAALHKVEVAGLAVLDHHRALANNGAALDAFVDMSVYVRTKSGMSDRMREIAILGTGFATKSDYITSTHTALAQNAGVTEDEISAILSGDADYPSFSDLERSIINFSYVSSAPRPLRRPETSVMKCQLAPSELMEVLMTVGWYHLCSTIFGALELAGPE